MDGSSKSSKIVPEEERPTNTGSGSNEEDDENAGWVDWHAIFIVSDPEILRLQWYRVKADGCGLDTVVNSLNFS